MLEVGLSLSEPATQPGGEHLHHPRQVPQREARGEEVASVCPGHQCSPALPWPADRGHGGHPAPSSAGRCHTLSPGPRGEAEASSHLTAQAGTQAQSCHDWSQATPTLTDDGRGVWLYWEDSSVSLSGHHKLRTWSSLAAGPGGLGGS